ncbi:MAG: hypothetical protein A3G33_02085 [Omnitrophica bacterium RIFCSPLOWO2_12_FULL_44_17]|uniref:Four helix bundle protein n=1 Tax=Candidatus Danuiimicrobium aquiferis TaxID=1801832 RepID=A0A1G1KTF2_9BACT|nr:MAG: hypothetical protein A3B72_04195 [Omnitrophica bacterium RIFCSPHIGHO2_02_FULL_45_28]OGW96125.1 MAG: hypothetical protein A3G33_02085 [Omnitrophica bacterium RIFCSPLOWO2_12_FULL_44_17]OGX01755.1 MAG: hypothetical protein A3J12_03700 [Omnitrophica bacterium RIFCSPLOWO2_02_FULL_44_11]
MKTIKTFLDLEVYQLAHNLAMKIFEISKIFPKEEKYSLVDQILRASRSVAVNIAEGWGKRKYVSLFKRHLVDAIGSLEETKAWLLFSLDCHYLTQEKHDSFLRGYEELGAKLFKLHSAWRNYS